MTPTIYLILIPVIVVLYIIYLKTVLRKLPAPKRRKAAAIRIIIAAVIFLAPAAVLAVEAAPILFSSTSHVLWAIEFFIQDLFYWMTSSGRIPCCGAFL